MNEEEKLPVAITLGQVVSSQIHSVGHDAPTATLAIRFRTKDGEPAALYHYANVTDEDFNALKSAESVGSHFYKNIKPFADRFPYVCIEKKPAVEGEKA